MAGVQVKALFDFASGGPNELGFHTNEVLTVTRQDVGGGWWEAVNSRGEEGLVPESYLEIIQNTKPLPPVNKPSLVNAPPQYQQAPPSNSRTQKPSYTGNAQKVVTQQEESYDDWDDDWDDDDDASTIDNTEVNRPVADANGNQHKVLRRREDKSHGQSGNVRMTFNRFSQFNRTGVDSFLFETTEVHDSDKNAVIIHGNNGPLWKGIDRPFSCILTSPKKETKFHGIKTFIAYQLTPSFSNMPVSRRYKHFDWLQQRLAEKFSVLAVPPLPEKQIAGRFEDDFVNQRLRMLQLWMDRMCQHPVIAHSKVFHHFLTCADDKKWKVGKRDAEKDIYIGAKFFFTVQIPLQPLDPRESEAKIDTFGKLLRSMDDSVKSLTEVCESNTKKHEGPFKKEFQKLGNSFSTLGKSFASDDRPEAQSLTGAVEHTGRTYDEIGHLFERQPPNDMHFLLEGLHEYRGLLSTFPDTLLLQKSALAKVQDGSNKLPESEQQQMLGRVDVITSTVLAEIDHFNQNRVTDFRGYMQKYIQGQINFYKQVTAKLEDALKQYD